MWKSYYVTLSIYPFSFVFIGFCLYYPQDMLILFQTEREQFYARISAGNIVYQNVMTSDLPEANDSLLSLSTRVRI